MKPTRFNRLVRGCFTLTLTLADWLELEGILARSRAARRRFYRQAQRKGQRSVVANGLPFGLGGPGGWLTLGRIE